MWGVACRGWGSVGGGCSPALLREAARGRPAATERAVVVRPRADRLRRTAHPERGRRGGGVDRCARRSVPDPAPRRSHRRSDGSQVMYALSSIGDPRAVAAFRRGLDDPAESVRASAATGLARLGTEDALAACIRTLDDAPDPLHLDMTPAVDALGGMGLSAAPALLAPLASANSLTRLHAERALQQIVYRKHGWVAGRGSHPPRTNAPPSLNGASEATTRLTLPSTCGRQPSPRGGTTCARKAGSPEPRELAEHAQPTSASLR